MAATPTADADIADKFGPHLAYSVGPNPRAAAEPDRLVKTHCCFCGQQCGIQLKVKGNQVVGFEPWEEFPFNRGMLCPKGVKRYLQGCAPRPPAQRLRARAERPRRLHRRSLQPSDRKSRRRHPTHPVGPRQRRLRRAERRQPDDGKSLPDGQIRPRLPQDAVHRLQRPALHGQRRRRPTRRPSASTAPPTPGPTSSRPRWSGSAAPTSPNAPRSRRTTSGRRANTGPRSSWSIRASRPSRAPATCSCPSSPAATSPCSTASCT